MIKFKKKLLSVMFIGVIFSSTIFVSSCSGSSVSQKIPRINVITSGTNIEDLKSFSYMPIPDSPSFFKDNKLIDFSDEKNSIILEYWVNIIGPMYSMAISSLKVDSANNDSNNLSINDKNRDKTFNYFISNSWISGSGIYVPNSEYKFRTSPNEMRFEINGKIPPPFKEKDKITTENVKSIINVRGLEFDFSYFDINNGDKWDSTKAILALEKIFKINNFKSKYTVKFNLSSKTTYEVVKIDGDKSFTEQELLDKNLLFDPKTMKVKITTDFFIGDVVTGTKIEPSKVLENFNNWAINTSNIESAYKNFILSIIGI